MEIIPPKKFICEFCYEESPDLINYDCNHRVCFNCLPLTILEMIYSVKLITSELINNDIELQCLWCDKGKVILNKKIISKFM